ncbi:MAG: branched-chain amino acid transport system ATP-binding protein [Solirubrobacteraceae bacterium]|jgi:branched-chain amino acid transport system ATP-binding protein|nr:branched-chain amino acid transport system ATP-binding protein [Solirubrobacteraceae bacterium]
MLRVERLNVSYGAVAALRDVDLSVEEGELVGVVGPNGAGKSTLLNAIGGGVRTTSGSITIGDRSIVGLAPDAIVRTGISLVPEGRRIFGTLTVGENLKVALAPRTDRAAARADVDRMLELFPVLQRYLQTPAGRLSGGEQQQLAIARALLSKPRLLLVDEPSLGLAPIVVDRVFDLLVELRRTGVTILLVEQNASQALAIADRMYMLRTGRIEALERTPELAQAIDSGELYFGAPVAGGVEG